MNKHLPVLDGQGRVRRRGQRAHACIHRRGCAGGLRRRHCAAARAARLATRRGGRLGGDGGHGRVLAGALRRARSRRAAGVHGQRTPDAQRAWEKDRHARRAVGRDLAHARPAACLLRACCVPAACRLRAAGRDPLSPASATRLLCSVCATCRFAVPRPSASKKRCAPAGAPSTSSRSSKPCKAGTTTSG